MRLRASFQSKMHGVSPEYRAADAAVSLQAGPGRLAEEQRQNEKLEHQVPPTGYGHTDTCRNRMKLTDCRNTSNIQSYMNMCFSSWNKQA